MRRAAALFIRHLHTGAIHSAPGQNDDVDPEDSINYEAGVRYLGGYVRGMAIGFYNDYDNLVATCRQGSGCDPEQIDEQFNAGGVDVWGLEFLIDSAPALGWEVRTPISVSYTLTESNFRDDFSSADPVLGEVDNAYIVSRRPFGARPGKPFQVMGGIKYQFGG